MAKGTDKPLVPKEIRSIRDSNKKCSAKVMRRVIWVAYLGEGPGDPSALANPAVVDTRYDRQCERNMRATEMIVGSPGMVPMAQLLEQSAARHSHLCPRQVLGVRMGLLAGRELGLDVPNAEKSFLTLMETDGCAADGVSAATGCTVGNRRLRVLDFGKVAATFVDTKRDKAIRIVPRNGIRAEAQRQVPDAESRWHAQLNAYQVMPDADLLAVQLVNLSISLEKLLSKPGYRVNCEACGEEIINEREVVLGGTMLCRACAGQSYYRLAGQDSTQLCLDEIRQTHHALVERTAQTSTRTALTTATRTS